MYIDKTITGFDCRELDYMVGYDIDFNICAFRWNIETKDWELFDTESSNVLCKRVNFMWEKV